MSKTLPRRLRRPAASVTGHEHRQARGASVHGPPWDLGFRLHERFLRLGVLLQSYHKPSQPFFLFLKVATPLLSFVSFWFERGVHSDTVRCRPLSVDEALAVA